MFVHAAWVDLTQMISRSVPFGFAAYDKITPEAAAVFDQILDTFCCGKCTVCDQKPLLK